MAPDRQSAAPLAYDRDVLLTVLIYHYRKDIGGCGCGYRELGASHPEHVADVYEESVRARTAVVPDGG